MQVFRVCTCAAQASLCGAPDICPVKRDGLQSVERAKRHEIMSEKHEDLLEFKRRDASSYDESTDEFDRYTERFTGAIAARVVECAQLGPEERVLDVGSGTGVVTFKAAARVAAKGKIVGIDLSDGMLRKAREKSAHSGSGGLVSFLKMDAEALVFPDGAFDCVLSLYALRHFPRPEAALAEMRRVLRPGGRVVVAVGSGPRLLSRHGLAAAYRRIRSVMRGLRGARDLVACGYLNELVAQHLPSTEPDEEAGWTREHHVPSSVPRMMQAAGFERIQSTWAGHDGIVDSREDFWGVQVTFSSVARKRLAAASADAIARLRRDFDAGCACAQEAGGRLRYPTGALIVTGRRR
jgi:ubiquinone/menaquinone biosynthesis C-methylase UbiE